MNSAPWAGGILLAAGTAAAENGPQKLTGYAEVDQELFRGISRVQDPASKTKMERKHKKLTGQHRRRAFFFGKDRISGRYP